MSIARYLELTVCGAAKPGRQAVKLIRLPLLERYASVPQCLGGRGVGLATCRTQTVHSALTNQELDTLHMHAVLYCTVCTDCTQASSAPIPSLPFVIRHRKTLHWIRDGQERRQGAEDCRPGPPPLPSPPHLSSLALSNFVGLSACLQSVCKPVSCPRLCMRHSHPCSEHQARTLMCL